MVLRIGAGNPMLGQFPVDPQAFEGLANGLVADLADGPALLDTRLGDQRKRPEARLEATIARRTVQQRLESIGIDA